MRHRRRARHSKDHRKFENVVGLILIFCAFPLARELAIVLVLCLVYGIGKVWHEDLQVTEMPHLKGWTISNGDRLGKTVTNLGFLLWGVLWLGMTAVLFNAIRKVLPRAKPSAHERSGFQRRSLTGKKQIFRTRALLFMIAWLFAIFVVVVLGHRLGVITPFVLLASLIWLLVTYLRSEARQLHAVVGSTTCPNCGKGPMDYVDSSEDDRRLLLCTNCRIEWDLGPL